MTHKSCNNCVYLLSDKNRNLNCCNAFHDLTDVESISSHSCSEWEKKKEDNSYSTSIERENWGRIAALYTIDPQSNLPRADEFPATTRNFSYFISELVARQSVDIECRFGITPSYVLMNPRTYHHYRRDLPFHRDGQTINGMPIITASCIPDNEVEVVPSLSSHRATDPFNPSSFRGWR